MVMASLETLAGPVPDPLLSPVSIGGSQGHLSLALSHHATDLKRRLEAGCALGKSIPPHPLTSASQAMKL